jgi:hypothetical protein
MIYETDPGLSPDLRQYGCAVECVARYSPEMRDEELNAIVVVARARKILDAEDTVGDWQRLVDLFGFPLRYRDGHLPASTPVDAKTMWLVSRWFNPNSGKYHFVVMDGKGIKPENVLYDPIEGGSLTVRQGHFMDYRIFDILEA